MTSPASKEKRQVPPVTGETITDKQIRSSGASDRDIYRATRKTDRYWTRSMRLFRQAARARCAAAYNARFGGQFMTSRW